MFTGDSSGDWLYEALYRFGFATQPESNARDDGLQLIDCYITAAARCAPPQNKPSALELANCQPYLEAELALLGNKRVVLTLGRIAHERYLRASGCWSATPVKERPRFGHNRTAELGGVTLLTSFHPSRQNTNTGRLTRRMWHAVFRTVRKLLG